MIQPIYENLSVKLEAYIRKNHPTGKLPGILRLAREFGVHHVTLAKSLRILENKGLVTIQNKSGTFVHLTPERPHYGCIGVFGATAHELDDLPVLRSLSDYCDKCYQVIGIFQDHKISEDNPSYMLNFPVDAFLFRGSSLQLRAAEMIHQAELPLVCTARMKNLPWLNTIDNDICGGYAEAIRYLRELGHRRIGFIEFGRSEFYRYHLFEYYEMLHCEMGGDYDENMIFIKNPESWYLEQFGSNAYHEYAKLAFQHFFSLSKPPTALLVGVHLAAPMKLLLIRNGLKVPENVSIIKVQARVPENDEFSCIYYNEIDKLLLALRRLEELLGGDNTVKKELINMALKEGQSSAPVKIKRN